MSRCDKKPLYYTPPLGKSCDSLQVKVAQVSVAPEGWIFDYFYLKKVMLSLPLIFRQQITVSKSYCCTSTLFSPGLNHTYIIHPEKNTSPNHAPTTRLSLPKWSFSAGLHYDRLFCQTVRRVNYQIYVSKLTFFDTNHPAFSLTPPRCIKWALATYCFGVTLPQTSFVSTGKQQYSQLCSINF